MKIKIRSANKNLTLFLPNRLILSNNLWRLVGRFNKEAESKEQLPGGQALAALSGEDIKLVRSCLKQMKKKYPGLALVEVSSLDGTEIKVYP